MKQVTHRVYKYHLRPLPAERKCNQVFMERYCKTISITCLSHCSQTLCHAFCIAVLTALADLSATSYWIPSHLSPLDMGVSCQYIYSLRRCWAMLRAACLVDGFGFAVAKHRRN